LRVRTLGTVYMRGKRGCSRVTSGSECASGALPVQICCCAIWINAYSVSKGCVIISRLRYFPLPPSPPSSTPFGIPLLTPLFLFLSVLFSTVLRVGHCR